MEWTDVETNIMRDIFLLMKHNASAENTEAYWNSLSEQVGQICAKYGGHDMAVHFCVAACQFYEELTKKSA